MGKLARASSRGDALCRDSSAHGCLPREQHTVALAGLEGALEVVLALPAPRPRSAVTWYALCIFEDETIV